MLDMSRKNIHNDSFTFRKRRLSFEHYFLNKEEGKVRAEYIEREDGMEENRQPCRKHQIIISENVYEESMMKLLIDYKET